MEILHTPWRREFVVAARDYEGCLFCNLLAADKPDTNKLILHRAAHAFLILNAYPYTPGHLMAVPYRHAARTTDLAPEELREALDLCCLGEKLLRRAYGCLKVHGGANLGAAAGAGVPGHLHFHIVAQPAGPLWERCKSGDAPPESLEQTHRRLRQILAAM